jgi:hypothetical protein
MQLFNFWEGLCSRELLHHPILQNSYNFFVWAQLYKTFTDRSTYLGNLFVAVSNAWQTRWHCIRRSLRCLVIHTFYSSGGSLLWRDSIIEFSVRVALSTGKLNSLKKHEVYKSAKGRKCSASVRREVSAAREAVTGSPRKCAMSNKTGRGLKQQCMENMSWWLLVSARNGAQSGIVRRWNNKTLHFCEGLRRATGGKSECLICLSIVAISTENSGLYCLFTETHEPPEEYKVLIALSHPSYMT